MGYRPSAPREEMRELAGRSTIGIGERPLAAQAGSATTRFSMKPMPSISQRTTSPTFR